MKITYRKPTDEEARMYRCRDDALYPLAAIIDREDGLRFYIQDQSQEVGFTQYELMLPDNYVDNGCHSYIEASIADCKALARDMEPRRCEDVRCDCENYLDGIHAPV